MDSDCLRYLSIKEYQRKTPSPPLSRSPSSKSSTGSEFTYNLDEVVFTMNKHSKVDVNRIYSHLIKQKKRNSFSY